MNGFAHHYAPNSLWKSSLVFECIFYWAVPIFLMISAIPVGGIIIVVGCILGLLYTVYQLLEKILFEMFIINLPY